MKMQLERTDRNIFFKNLLSYFIILIIPTIFLSTFMYASILPKIKNELELSNIRAIEHANQVIDSQLMTMQQIANMISNDQKMTRFELQKSPISMIEATKQLARYKISTSFIEDIFLYYKDDDKIYSYMGQSSMYTFSHLIYKYDNWDASSIYIDLNSINKMVVRPFERVKRNGTEDSVITFIYPIPINNESPCGAIVFIISAKTFAELLANTFGEYDSYIGVFDEKNNLVYELNKGVENFSADMFSSYNNGNPSDVKEIVVGHKAYSFLNHQSQYTNWTIRGLVLTEQYMFDFNKTRGQAYTLIFTTLIISIIVGYLFTSSNYKQIENLAVYIRQLFPLSPGHVKKNELEMIKLTVDYAADRNRKLKESIDQHKKILLNQEILMLLQGSLDNEKIRKVISSIGFKEEDMCFYAMLICDYNELTTHNYNSNSEWKEKVLQQCIFAGNYGYGVQQVLENECLILLINSVDTSNISEIQMQIIREIIDILPTAENSDFRFAVGKPYKNAVNINKSFIEASIAMEHNILSLSNPIIFFKDIAAAQYNQMWYPIEEKLRLQHSLKQGNSEIAIEILHEIISRLTSSRMSLNMVKAICIDIINTIMEVGVELNVEAMASDLEIAMGFETYSDLERKLGVTIEKICFFVNKQKNLGTVDLCNDIVIYVNKNFRNYDLTLGHLAEKFGLSVPYLSTIFKHYIGINFSDYLSDLRVEEAKYLLGNSDMSLKDITESVGYVDLPSFNRKFKKNEGITMGQYRTINQGEM